MPSKLLRRLRGSLLIILIALAAGPAAAAFEAGALGGVARIDIALDPFSAGPQLRNELRRQVVRSPFENELRRRLEVGSSGSAFCVAPGLLITNAHVALAGARYTGLKISPSQWDSLEAEVLAFSRPWIMLNSSTSGKVRLPGRVVAIDRANDLALIRCQDPGGVLQPLELADPARLRVGMPIVSLGYVLEGLRVTRGKVESLIRGQAVVEPARVRSQPGTRRVPIIVGADTGQVRRLQHSAPTEAGMSGGPLLDENGKVIGVAYGLLRSTRRVQEAFPTLQLGIAVGIVKQFLAEQADNLPAASHIQLTQDELVTREPSGELAARAAWVGSTEELASIERRLRLGNTNGVIPLLESRIFHNRYDFRARALLAMVHHQESRFATQTGAHLPAAFYQTAWLAWFAPEEEYGENARRYLEEAGVRARVSQYAATPGIKTLLVSLDLQALLERTLHGGALGGSVGGARQEMEKLLTECEKLRARSASSDVVAAAALVQAYLAVEQAWELSPRVGDQSEAEAKERRADLLRKALAVARPLAAQLERSPGAQALLGFTYGRFNRLASRPELQAKMQQLYERASSLDPSSPTVKSALAGM